MGDNLPAVPLGTGRTVLAVEAGHLENCAILDDHALKCWGFNSSGGLGLGDTVGRGDDPGEMGDALPIVDLGTGHTMVPVARVRAQVQSGQARVVAGQVIGYTITVTNTGGLPLSRVEVIAPDVPDCARVLGDLPPAEVATYPCSYTTDQDDVPLMTNQVLAVTGQGAFALSGTRRTRVDTEVLRPDALLRLGAGAFVGNNVYNRTGSGQIRSATVRSRGVATFTVRAQNDGNTTSTFSIRGLGPTDRFAVTYRNGTTNVTAAVLAGTFTTNALARGAAQDLTLTIQAKPGTPIGTVLNRVVTVTSTADNSIRDAVKATVTRR
jgi:uncharacterized repeat protein (TIGR01451 family)